MKVTLRQFERIEKIVRELHAENYDNAQGDNAMDVRDRKRKYVKRVERVLTRRLKMSN